MVFLWRGCLALGGRLVWGRGLAFKAIYTPCPIKHHNNNIIIIHSLKSYPIVRSSLRARHRWNMSQFEMPRNLFLVKGGQLSEFDLIYFRLGEKDLPDPVIFLTRSLLWAAPEGLIMIILSSSVPAKPPKSSKDIRPLGATDLRFCRVSALRSPDIFDQTKSSRVNFNASLGEISTSRRKK